MVSGFAEMQFKVGGFLGPVTGAIKLSSHPSMRYTAAP
jgi:hypothetical protein